jgi:dTDP-4-amino-4,6-dideoxygalactose transaminase
MIYVTKSEMPALSEYTKYLKEIWKTSILTNNGAFVQELERKLKQFLGVENLSLVSNGTVALQLVFQALQLKGEVITTPFTFVATTNVIIWEKLKPVFADIDPHTFSIDPKDVERKISKHTAAILAVHVYGNPSYVEDLENIGKRHGIPVLYDAAHAFGVEYKNKPLLLWGDASTLSFHATKIYHTIEGGAVVTKTKALTNEVRLLRNFGIISEEEAIRPGINAKMNEYQAVMGLCNLSEFEHNVSKRKRLYEVYKDALKDCRDIRFQTITASSYNYSYMPVVFSSHKLRDYVHDQLVLNKIKPRKYFYPLISTYPFLAAYGVNVSTYPNAEMISESVLCLPLYATLPLSTAIKITQIIKKSIQE